MHQQWVCWWRHSPPTCSLLIFWFHQCHCRNNLLFICIISVVIISSTCHIIFNVIFSSTESKNSNANKILYHTLIHRELKVLLIPYKQLHLSSSRQLGSNPTKRATATGFIMSLWTSQTKAVVLYVLLQVKFSRISPVKNVQCSFALANNTC